MVNSPTLTASCKLATELAEPRASIQPKLDRLLGHLARYPDNVLVFHKSDMVYHAQSDVSYLSESRAKSRIGGYGYMGSNNAPTFRNGAVTNISKTFDCVVSSSAEGEYGAAYIVARDAVYIRAIAKALGYPQTHPTIILCDNSTAVGLANDTVKIAKTKSIDMRFHWLRDRVRQRQFAVKWVKSGANIADFFTKALPVNQHVARMHQLVQVKAATPRATRALNWRTKRTNHQ